MTETFTVIDNGEAHSIAAEMDAGRVRVAPGDLGAALGWELKPQGFCKDDMCYPAPRAGEMVTAKGIDLGAFADLIGRPLALDVDERAAFLGVAAAERAERLASLEAPDFTLPDLDGNLHSLSEARGKKVLLAAYGSW